MVDEEAKQPNGPMQDLAREALEREMKPMQEMWARSMSQAHAEIAALRQTVEKLQKKMDAKEKKST